MPKRTHRKVFFIASIFMALLIHVSVFAAPLAYVPLAVKPVRYPRVWAQASQLTNATKLAYFNGKIAVSNPAQSKIYQFNADGSLGSLFYNFTGALGFDVGDFSTNPVYTWKNGGAFSVIGYHADVFGNTMGALWDNFDFSQFSGSSINRVTEVEFHRFTNKALLIESNTGEIFWTKTQNPIDPLFDMYPIVFPGNYSQATGEFLRHVSEDVHSDLFYFATKGYIFSSSVNFFNIASLILSKSQIMNASGGSDVDLAAFSGDGQKLFFYDNTTRKLYQADMTGMTINITGMINEAFIQSLTGAAATNIVDLDVVIHPISGLAKSLLLLDAASGSIIQVFLPK